MFFCSVPCANAANEDEIFDNFERAGLYTYEDDENRDYGVPFDESKIDPDLAEAIANVPDLSAITYNMEAGTITLDVHEDTEANLDSEEGQSEGAPAS